MFGKVSLCGVVEKNKHPKTQMLILTPIDTVEAAALGQTEVGWGKH